MSRKSFSIQSRWKQKSIDVNRSSPWVTLWTFCFLLSLKSFHLKHSLFHLNDSLLLEIKHNKRSFNKVPSQHNRTKSTSTSKTWLSGNFPENKQISERRKLIFSLKHVMMYIFLLLLLMVMLTAYAHFSHQIHRDSRPSNAEFYSLERLRGVTVYPHHVTLSMFYMLPLLLIENFTWCKQATEKIWNAKKQNGKRRTISQSSIRWAVVALMRPAGGGLWVDVTWYSLKNLDFHQLRHSCRRIFSQKLDVVGLGLQEHVLDMIFNLAR